MKLKVLLFFVSAIALASCVDIPDFSDTPRIFYNGIDQYTFEDELGTGEKVIITIDFEDGNGDLGASPEEYSSAEFRKQYGNWGNYELITARKLANGQWFETILSVDSVKWLPILKPDGKPGPIKGKLDLNTNFYKGNSSIPVTVKFKIRIRDRALNVSNQIETDTVVVPGNRL